MEALNVKNPAPRCTAGTGLGMEKPCVVAGFYSDHSTDAHVVQRLVSRFRISPASAGLIALLAGLGSKEARHG